MDNSSIDTFHIVSGNETDPSESDKIRSEVAAVESAVSWLHLRTMDISIAEVQELFPDLDQDEVKTVAFVLNQEVANFASAIGAAADALGVLE